MQASRMSANVAALNVMKGGAFYNRHSAFQTKCQEHMMPYVLRAAAASVPDTCSVWRMADLGCSQGANSIGPVSACVAAVRAQVPDVPVTVLHGDLPANDHASLVHTINAGYAATPNLFASIVGRSYYERLVPPNELDLVLAFVTLHWLASPPSYAHPAAFYPAHPKVSSDELETVRLQARTQLRRFLELRAVECRSGARLVLSMVASDDAGWGNCHCHHLMEGVYRDLVDESIVRAEDVSCVVVPEYMRRRCDIEDALQGAAMDSFSVDCVETTFVTCPHREREQRGEITNAEATALVVGSYLAVFENALLGTRLAEHPTIRHEIQTRLAQKLTESGDTLGFGWHHAFVGLTRV